MRDRGRSIGYAALLLAGCRAEPDPWAELPTPDQHGERVSIATDAAERVCAGTLATIDAEVERIELELELDTSEEPYRMWILEPARASSICGGESSCTNTEHGAVVSADNFEVERRPARELTPLMLQRDGFAAYPFFIEGLAGAMSWPSCPTEASWISAGDSWINDVSTVPLAQQLAGELIRWLLAEYGLEQLLNYIDLVPGDSASTIAAYYTAYFGSTIESDLQEHMARGAQGAHCFAPEPEASGSRFLRLQASLDCESPRVQTDFDTPGFGFVEWTLPAIPKGFYELRGELPEGSHLEITYCMCDRHWSPFEPFNPAGELLFDGPYQLRWRGPLDAGLELDVELGQPCSVAEQDCDSGEKCLHPERPCQPLVDEPIAIGESCTVAADEPDPCVAGAWCFGDTDEDGLVTGACVRQCDSEDACLAGERCVQLFSWGFCAPLCNDPIGNDCPANMNCDSFFGDELLCAPAGPGTLLEPCNWTCAPGFVCAYDDSNFPCEDACCMPVCDPTLAGADCPAELPVCNGSFGPNDSFGYCSSG